jgi:sporulation protein YlmC with PRC-barrel domain
MSAAHHPGGKAIGPESYPVGTSLPELERLKDLPVMSADGETIGRVEDVYVDEENSWARYIAIATDWLDAKLLVVPVDDVTHAGDAPVLTVPYTKAQLEGAPTYSAKDALTIDREEEVYAHYERTPYWNAVRARQTTPAPTPEIAEAEAVDLEASGAYVDDLDVVAHQTEPAPTPRIAEAEVEDAIARGEDPERVRVKRWGV